jgi:hypothetical protein
MTVRSEAAGNQYNDLFLAFLDKDTVEDVQQLRSRVDKP